tara:strand:- start:2568 stop:3143 length:576 start_codon:yes stop_codon:yes gene_type:complete
MSEEEKPAADQAGQNVVPYDRFQAVNNARKEAEARAGSLEQKILELEKVAGSADVLFGQVESLNKQLAQERAAFDTERSLMGAGLIEQEARDIALFGYQRTPEENRPPLADWLSGMKENPESIPAYLSPYLKTAAPKQDAAPASPSLPDTNRGTVPTNPESAPYSRGKIANMTTEEYLAHRDVIRQQYLKK